MNLGGSSRITRLSRRDLWLGVLQPNQGVGQSISPTYWIYAPTQFREIICCASSSVSVGLGAHTSLFSFVSITSFTRAPARTGIGFRPKIMWIVRIATELQAD
jgi:hypothetical protein